MRFADLDAVTVDCFGTLVGLVDPVPALRRALRARGVHRSAEVVRAAFAAEVAFYKPRAMTGRDAASLAALRLASTRVFLEAAGAELEPESFVDDFIASLALEPIPGAIETAVALRRRGLLLAVVSNWDVGLGELLARLGVRSLFAAVVTTAEAGVPKADPALFLLALGKLGAEPGRTLHVGDEVDDERGALAAGLRFAPAPLATAFAGWR